MEQSLQWERAGSSLLFTPENEGILYAVLAISQPWGSEGSIFYSDFASLVGDITKLPYLVL